MQTPSDHPARDRPSDLLVAAQVVAIAGLAWPGSPRWHLPRVVTGGSALAVVIGGGVALAAGAHLGKDLRPAVEPRPGATLRTDGVYGLSRHPLYAGLLVASTGVAVLRRRPEPLVALAALSAVLHVKSGVEETRLARRFGAGYADYVARTPKLLGLPTTGRA